MKKLIIKAYVEENFFGYSQESGLDIITKATTMGHIQRHHLTESASNPVKSNFRKDKYY